MSEGIPDGRAHRLAVAVLLFLAFGAFARLLVTGQVPMFRDHRDYFQPLRHHTAAVLKEGQLPLWNPYSASGEPWLANPQTGVFYPPSWVFLLLPFATAYVLYLALHLAVLGTGTYAMLATRLSSPAALAGAAILMCSGPVFSLIDISNNLATFAWIPWVIWGALAGKSPARAGAFLALAFLGGEPFYAGVAAVLYAVVVRNPRRIVATGVVAAGLSAVQLLPFLEMLRGSDRAAGLPADQIYRDSATLADWLRMAVPPQLTADVIDPALSQHFITIVYVGMLAALLAVVGSIAGGRKALPWLTLLAIALAVSTGARLGVVAAILEHAPVTLFRYPARMIPLGALAVAALAALGWERIRPERRWIDVALLLVLVVDAGVHSTRVLLAAPFGSDRLPYDRSVGHDSKILRVGDRTGADRSAWITGYYNLYDRRFDSWSAAPVMSARYDRWFREAFSGKRLDLVDRFPAGWILSDRDLAGRFTPVSKVRTVTAYRNERAMPMATLWTAPQFSDSPKSALDAALDARNRGEIFVTPRVQLPAGGERAIVPARIVSVDARRVEVTVQSPWPGILVLMQQDAPGWKVSVDGKPAEKLLVDGIFRGVALPAGAHRVQWSYLPQSLIFGSVMTFVTLAFLQLRRFVKGRRA